MFIIQSTHSRISLTFSNLRRDNLESFDVEIKGLNFFGKKRVMLDANNPPIVFFQYLNEHQNGWKRKKTWHSFEKELILEATHDSMGHIKLSVSISNGEPYDWRLSGILELEAGQLEEISHQIETFFHEG